MIHPNRLENDSIMAPVAQEAGIIELSLEQLEGIQGGNFYFFRDYFLARSQNPPVVGVVPGYGLQYFINYFKLTGGR